MIPFPTRIFPAKDRTDMHRNGHVSAIPGIGISSVPERTNTFVCYRIVAADVLMNPPRNLQNCEWKGFRYLLVLQ